MHEKVCIIMSMTSISRARTHNSNRTTKMLHVSSAYSDYEYIGIVLISSSRLSFSSCIDHSSFWRLNLDCCRRRRSRLLLRCWLFCGRYAQVVQFSQKWHALQIFPQCAKTQESTQELYLTLPFIPFDSPNISIRFRCRIDWHSRISRQNEMSERTMGMETMLIIIWKICDRDCTS